jgi:enoyl-CoA hydratase
VTQTLILDRPQPGVVVLQLNRPEALNAINEVMRDELTQTLATIGADASVNVVVLTGAGRGFCSGIDVRNFGGKPLEASDPAIERLRFQEAMAALPQAIWDLPQPVIAAVNGPAAGFGLALTLGSDIRYAARSAVLRAVFINIGVSNCDMGTSWLLPRLIGASRAHELMLTGRRVSADEALAIGLVADVVDDGTVVERALEAAEQIAAWSPWGIRLTKAGMWSALEIPSAHAAVEYEDRQQIMALHGAAPQEAVSAFLEKRAASFVD